MLGPENNMTEGRYITKEELSRNAQYAKERHEEISKYLSQLMKEVDFLVEKRKRANKLEFMFLLALVLAIFAAPPSVVVLAQIGFWFYFFYNIVTISMSLRFVYGEVSGAIHILELLNLVPKIDDEDTGTKKKVKTKKFSLIEQMWEKTKQKKRAEAYA